MMNARARSFVDHLDVRVRDIGRARVFYDAFCAALGLTRITESDGCLVYGYADRYDSFLAIDADPQFQPNRTRIAFRAASRSEVDRIAAVAARSGAVKFEPPHLCTEYTPDYYASFFSDPDGNDYEVCYRSPAGDYSE